MIKERKNFRILFLLSLIQNVKRKITEIAPDVVHAISAGYHYSLAAVFLRDKYPALLTAYGITAKQIKYYKEEYKKIQKIRTYILSPIHIIKERYVLSKIQNIIVQTPSIKDIISKWTKSKIYIAPSGIEYDEIETIQLHSLLNESPDIFFVNNLQKIKGADILIKAQRIHRRNWTTRKRIKSSCQKVEFRRACKFFRIYLGRRKIPIL
jgi:glycosyltransferase involved in cell wall biosynthesis